VDSGGARQRGVGQWEVHAVTLLYGLQHLMAAGTATAGGSFLRCNGRCWVLVLMVGRLLWSSAKPFRGRCVVGWQGGRGVDFWLLQPEKHTAARAWRLGGRIGLR